MLSERHERILRIESLEPIDTFYKALDGYILASRYEGLSLSAMEALATNLPLILTAVAGNVDLGRIGLDTLYWAPANDADALASAICSWASCPPRWPNHRNIGCRLFCDDLIHSRILQAYQDRCKWRATKHVRNSHPVFLNCRSERGRSVVVGPERYRLHDAAKH